jgi:hypothetical protein
LPQGFTGLTLHSLSMGKYADGGRYPYLIMRGRGGRF